MEIYRENAITVTAFHKKKLLSTGKNVVTVTTFGKEIRETEV